VAQNYPRLSVEDFGQHLLETGDLDPIYIGLGLTCSDWDHMSRWMVAYWCLYHAGASSYISDHTGEDFWHMLGVAAANELPAPDGGRWPRGHERRHWRGAKALESYKELSTRYSRPEDFVEHLAEAAPSYGEVTKRVQAHKQFGPWIAFKIADMLDTCGDVRIDFSSDDVMMFKDPEKAAITLWNFQQGLPVDTVPTDKKAAVKSSVDYLLATFADFDAPPRFARKVGIQEVETILCKWKSHYNGHYPLLNDTVEIAKGLASWAPYSPTAQKMALTFNAAGPA